MHLALLSACFPRIASAYYAPLLFIPEAPTAGQAVVLRVRFGICDALVVSGSQDRELVVQGNQIRVTATGIYAPDLPFCIYPDGYADFDIGPLAAGTYQVQFYRRDLFVPSDVDLVQSGNVVVGLAPAVPVPASNVFNLGVLGLLLVVTATRTVRVRSDQRNH